MSNDEGSPSGGGRRRPSPARASPLESEDTLSEILVRLPPAPSTLLRASLVSKLWHRLTSDPDFLRRFRARHRRNPPLLGFFIENSHGLYFAPALEPPDRVPGDRFSFPPMDDVSVGEWRFFKLREQLLSCRHGLVLRFHRMCLRGVQVWDPLTGDVSHISNPCKFNTDLVVVGEVLRAAGDVNGDGCSRHFEVVLLVTDLQNAQAFTSVYSSETGVWGNPMSIVCPSIWPVPTSGTLIGRSLYWSLLGEPHWLLEFDLDKQSLSVVDVKLLSPSVKGLIWIMLVDGVVGCLFLSVQDKIELWKRSSDYDGVAGWVLARAFKLDELLPPFKLDELLPVSANADVVKIVGID
ncbi:hypothetical protein PR202_ga12431 [Eleusine coracana subsp. coracana]|uniref:F-box domain-containing protein n=1 Tax=Eleusine coracana subsp. coracana TaxID=191504 RepID=A0AAV5CBH7_ELECO|nr:hypothetical protein PR202_ga12431 [Eleusine coracana subsp. coracana]